MPELAVRKTYKMFVNGQFIRSESGRVSRAAQDFQVPLGSRKDVRDAVVAAKKAQKGWAGKTPYNRGQIIYRLAELLEGRSDELAGLLIDEGSKLRAAEQEVQAAIDLTVSYAGWADKYAQVTSQVNPVSGPYFVFSFPEPIGTVGLLTPDEGGLLSLLGRLLPIIVSGNTVVAVFEENTLTRLTLGELVQGSDCPAGVINLISGKRSELAAILARHMGVGALDLVGASEGERRQVLKEGVENVKRLIVPSGDKEWLGKAATSIERIIPFTEVKTVWHPVGS